MNLAGLVLLKDALRTAIAGVPSGGRLLPYVTCDGLADLAEQWQGSTNAPRFEIAEPHLDDASPDGVVSLTGRVLLCDAVGTNPEVLMPARLHFFAAMVGADTVLQLLIDFDAPATVDLARSWNTGLTGALWGALTIAPSSLTFASCAIPATGPDPTGIISLPASLWPKGGAVAGLSFGGSITPGGDVWTAIDAALLKAGSSLSVSGSVAFDALDGSSLLTMRHDMGTAASAALPGLSDATLSLDAIDFAMGLGPWAWVPMTIAAEASLHLSGGTLSGTLQLPISAGPCRLMCHADPPLDLNHILGAVGLASVAGQLPAVADLGGLGIVGLSVEFDTASLAVGWAEVRVATDQSWTLIPDILSISPEFAVGKEFNLPGAEAYAHFAALWQLGASATDPGILLETTGDTGSGQIAARMAPGERFDTTAFFAHLLPGVGVPAIDLVDFELEGNYRTKSFALTTEAISDWTVDILGAEIGITDIEISAEHDGNGFSGRLDANVEIAGYVADISADLQGDRWEIDLLLPAAPVGELIDHLLYGVTLPDDLRDFELHNLAASLVPGQSFALSATSDSEIQVFSGFGFRVAAFSVDRTRSDPAATPTTLARWQLALDIGGHALLFDGAYKAIGGTSPVWKFEATLPGTALPLGDLLGKLTKLIGIELPLVVDHLQITDIDAVVTLDTRRSLAFSCAVSDSGSTDAKPYGDVAFAIREKAGGGWDYVIAADIDVAIGPEILPVVGNYLATPRFEVTQARLVMVSDGLSTDDQTALFGMIKQVPAAPALTITVAAGDQTHDIPIPFGTPLPADPGTAVVASPYTALTIEPVSATVVATPSDQTKWLDIGRDFGPVRLNGVGIRYREGRLAVVFDAGMALGPFSVALMGLGVSSSLSHFDPQATLDGLGFGFDAGGVSVSGGLMRITTGDSTGYAGQLSLTTPAASLTLLGEYVSSPQSLFVYGILDEPPLGGPAFFFVEGVAIGIGYNSHLTLPTDAAHVSDFSLVKAAFPPTMGKDGLLAAMGQDFAATPGAGWFAVGLRFNSFKLIDSFALASVEVGDQFEVSLLGLSRASLPPRASDPVALFEVGLLATFSPNRGVLKVNAALTSKSFILSHDAQLTGGYSFYIWFKDGSENGAGYSAGDFVYSMGGFHPHFQVPAHYPRPARLQLSWQVSSELSVKGDCYFALTPHALMAGMGIEAQFSMGDLSAWFDADADFLLSWKPFHYEGHIDCSIGVSYRVNLGFTSFHVTVHVGVGLDLHGPPFGGQADIDLSVVSFTISFGAGSPDRAYIGWDEFRTSFLHAADPDTVAKVTPGGSIQPVSGLVRDQSKTAKPDESRWVFRAEDAAFAVRFAAPAQTVRFDPGGSGVTALNATHWTQVLAVGPMGPLGALKSNDALVHLEFLKEADCGQPDVWELSDRMTFAPQLGNVAGAMWRPVVDPAPVDPPINLPTTIPDALTGFAVTPLPPVYCTTFEVDLTALRYETASPRMLLKYGDTTPPNSGSVAGVAKDGTLTLKRAGAADVSCRDYVLAVPYTFPDPIHQRRAAIVEALQQQVSAEQTMDWTIDMKTFATVTQLDDWPQICALGEELTR